MRASFSKSISTKRLRAYAAILFAGLIATLVAPPLTYSASESQGIEINFRGSPWSIGKGQMTWVCPRYREGTYYQFGPLFIFSYTETR